MLAGPAVRPQPQKRLLDAAGELLEPIAVFEAGGLGNNSLELVDLAETCGVSAMEIELQSSGAVDNISYCPDRSAD